jgi:hypothetical protein
MNEAWATFGEVGAAFGRYRVRDGWVLLEGPGGPAGHAWNSPGQDIVAYRALGDFALELNDNKALGSRQRVRDASSLTTNLLVNARAEQERALDPSFDGAPRIDQVRTALADTVRALEIGGPLPGSVSLVVTNYGGISQGVTRGLAAQGVRFIDVMPPGTRIAAMRRVPPELFEPIGAEPEQMTREFSPAMRATAAVTLALMAAGPLLDVIRDVAQRGRAQEKLNELRPRILDHLQASPEDGVLLVVVRRQKRKAAIPPDSFIGPVPIFHSIWVYYGRTKDEAIANFQSAPQLEGPARDMEFTYQPDIWIPPARVREDLPSFPNSERGLQPEARGTLPHERGLSGPSPPPGK